MVFTPPEIAKRWGVKPESVVSLIKSGRLAAFTVSPATSRRPRWKVTEAAVEAYEAGRVEPQVQVVKQRKRRPADVIQFYQ